MRTYTVKHLNTQQTTNADDDDADVGRRARLLFTHVVFIVNIQTKIINCHCSHTTCTHDDILKRGRCLRRRRRHRHDENAFITEAALALTRRCQTARA